MIHLFLNDDHSFNQVWEHNHRVEETEDEIIISYALQGIVGKKDNVFDITNNKTALEIVKEFNEREQAIKDRYPLAVGSLSQEDSDKAHKDITQIRQFYGMMLYNMLKPKNKV